MKETKATQISGKFFHKHKYLTNLDVTPEEQVIAELENMSQELKGKQPKHLSKTTLEQLTKLRNILKQKIEDKDEQQKIAKWIPSTTPPRVPTNK